MARTKRPPPQPQVGSPSIRDKQKALTILRDLINEGNDVLHAGRKAGLLTAWKQKASVSLSAILGENSETHRRFGEVHYSPGVFSNRSPESVFENAFRNGVKNACQILEAAVFQVETLFEDPTEDHVNQETAAIKRYDPDSKKVFVVHGHDETMRSRVVRFLEKGGLEAIVLHERPNLGRTIMEKFEAHAKEVSYAVVLLTADDVGGKNSAELNPRARQNVVFEYGFFMGALGRDRVCAILEPKVEKPSDIQGIVYISFDENWTGELTKELIHARVPFDPAKAFGG